MRVSTESRAVVTLDVTGPGDVLGEMALGLTSHRRSATVVALDECSTRMLTVAAFSALCLEHPGVAQATTQLLAERVDRLARQLVEALYVSIDRREARRIWSVAAHFGGPELGTEIPLIQQGLADLAGAARPTVNQTLKKFEAQRAIELFRGGVRIIDPVLLGRRAGSNSTSSRHSTSLPARDKSMTCPGVAVRTNPYPDSDIRFK